MASNLPPMVSTSVFSDLRLVIHQGHQPAESAVDLNRPGILHGFGGVKEVGRISEWRIRFEKAELDLQTWESMPILQFGMVRVYTTCRRISQTRELKSRVYRWCLTLPFTAGWSPSCESCERLPYTLCVRVLRPSEINLCLGRIRACAVFSCRQCKLVRKAKQACFLTWYSHTLLLSSVQLL